MQCALELLNLPHRRITRQKKMTVDTTLLACNWLAMKICVLDSKQIKSRQISSLKKKKNTNKKMKTALYLCKGFLKYHSGLRQLVTPSAASCILLLCSLHILLPQQYPVSLSLLPNPPPSPSPSLSTRLKGRKVI